MKTVFVFLLVALPLFSLQSQEKPRLAHVSDDLGMVIVRGVWRPDNPTKQNHLIEAVEEITCFHSGGKDIVDTEAFCLEAASSMPYRILNVSTTWLKVVEWNKSRIIAVDDSPDCLTSQLIFDLQGHTVSSLDMKKAGAKGLFDACGLVPERQTYYLEDIADYYAHKKSETTP